MENFSRACCNFMASGGRKPPVRVREQGAYAPRSPFAGFEKTLEAHSPLWHHQRDYVRVAVSRLLGTERSCMLSRAVLDRRAWQADSIAYSASWYYPIPEVCFT